MLIGLNGKMRCGKDTAAEFIVAWARGGFRSARREGFADRLKLSAYRLFNPEGTLREALEWSDWLKTKGVVEAFESGPILADAAHIVSGRQFLQRYGTEAHRGVFGEDFWIDAVLATYTPGEILVISDCRFPNEAEAIRAAGGEVWNIIRPGNVTVESSHASEQPLPPELIDVTIINDRPLDEYKEVVLTHTRRLLEGFSWPVSQ